MEGTGIELRKEIEEAGRRTPGKSLRRVIKRIGLDVMREE
jgi:hypothetical protein